MAALCQQLEPDEQHILNYCTIHVDRQVTAISTNASRVSSHRCAQACGDVPAAGDFASSEMLPRTLGLVRRRTRSAKRSPETGDLSLQVVMVAGARNQQYLEFCWTAA